jgi:AhpD family alkylhydroperoxidase
MAFGKAAVADGAIPGKYKELMGVAYTTQCPYCIEIHSDNARRLGTSDQEIAEARRGGLARRRGNYAWHARPEWHLREADPEKRSTL